MVMCGGFALVIAVETTMLVICAFLDIFTDTSVDATIAFVFKT